jgi:4-amino-4-deoxy-L-arabinose transferase and related glycosyltransferases of PMT family
MPRGKQQTRSPGVVDRSATPSRELYSIRSGEATGSSSSLRWAIGLLALGLILRLASAHIYWSWFDTRFPDTWEHSKIELSQNASQYILQADPGTWNSPLHHGWADRAFFRPPLASYYFVGLFRLFAYNRLAVSAVQSVVAIAAYLFLFLVSARVLGRRIALFGLALVMLHPVLMFEDTSFEDSGIGLLLMALAIYGTFWARAGKPERWVVCGLAIGLAALARPNLLAVAAGLAVLAWIWTPSSRPRALVALLGPIICLVWFTAVHNYHASDRWTLISDMTGQNLYWGNNPFPDHRLSVQGYWDILEVDRGNTGSLLIAGLKQRTGETAADPAFLSGAARFVRSEPLRALGGLLKKTWRHLSNYEIPRDRDFAWCRQANIVWKLPLIPFALLVPLALIGWRATQNRSSALLLVVSWLAVVATEVIFFNASRYRALALPFVLVLSVAGAVEVFRAVRARRWVQVGVVALLATATTILGQFAVPPAERVQHAAVASFKSAMLEAYADEDGQWNWFSQSRAEESLREATRLDPDNLDAFSVAQKLLIREGRFEEARANIAARRPRCRAGEWLCEDVCSYLEGMMGPPSDARESQHPK